MAGGKTLTQEIEISGVLDSSLQAAIQKAIQDLNKMSAETLKSASAGEKLAATIKSQETELKIAQRAYADYAMSGKEGTEEAQQLAQQIETLSRELDGNKGKLESAYAAAEKLARPKPRQTSCAALFQNKRALSNSSKRNMSHSSSPKMARPTSHESLHSRSTDSAQS